MNDSVDMHLKGPVIVDNAWEEGLGAAIRLSHWWEKEVRGLGQLWSVSRRKVISKGMASSGPISGGPWGQWLVLTWTVISGCPWSGRQASSSRAVDSKVLHYGLDSRRCLDFGDEYCQGESTALAPGFLSIGNQTRNWRRGTKAETQV